VAQTSLVLDAGGRAVAARGPRPPEAARRWPDQAGLGAEVLAGCDDDPARAAAEPGRVWRSGPAPAAQSPVGGRVRLWVNPGSCPAPTTTTTRAGRATTTTGR
jgi:hypothetical protein